MPPGNPALGMQLVVGRGGDRPADAKSVAERTRGGQAIATAKVAERCRIAKRVRYLH